MRKGDFARMRVVGQFNLGFILAVRPGDGDASSSSPDLFIIDQHAADEKIQYERLVRTQALAPQPLARPPAPGPHRRGGGDCAAAWRRAGAEWGFACARGRASGGGGAAGPAADGPDGPAAPAQPRAFYLHALPTCGGTALSPADLAELLHLLSEHAGPAAPASPSSSSPSSSAAAPPSAPSPPAVPPPRPRRVQALLAMRACRGSIMVGTALTGGQMGRVVGRLGALERPWNCPHGRPTMRHLARLGGGGGKAADADAPGPE